MPGDRSVDPRAPFRQLLSMERDVLVLSAAMFAFSLGFQMTSRYVPRYMSVLGAGAGVIGLYGSLGNLVSAVYPYPGGAVSDRLGSRRALTAFGLVSALGFLFWLLAPRLDVLRVGPLAVPPWAWIFVGLFLTQAWKSFGLGATFAVVKQSVPSDELAAGFASTETFRRVGFLVGPLLASVLIASAGDFTLGFQWVLAAAVAFAVAGTAVQHVYYDPAGDSIGDEFEGVRQVLDDLRGLPAELRPLLVADVLVRFANGMAYVFFVIVVTEFLGVGFTGFGVSLSPDAFFGVLLAVEMLVALLSMLPVSRLAERVGLKPVIAVGFAVYAAFPVLLVNAPADQWALVALFAFSGLRFAGLPAHKAMIVGPAEKEAGGRVTGTYYLVRNAVGIPSTAVGGAIYAFSPTLSFTLATVVGLLGTGYYLAFGREFAAYA
ncbi:major facilitator superfamily transport protein [Halobacterium hubeiense]|uniref:Major facilitator superfamily transport protein n=3 Tax=Halobacterium hubeiense TaxID=1407499 RepID=A0A0U5H1L7_9EURY|nr:major facilitator superfamily transport protein [Halobacterium hubeiense]